VVLLETDTEFLAKRQLNNRVWGSVGPLLIGGLIILFGFLWFAAPMLVNPFAVMNRLQEDSVDITTLQTMAIMLPMVFSLLCIVMLALIGIIYRSARIERYYLQLLNSQSSHAEVK